MILGSSEFRLVDRGFKNTLVLIPGWAGDWRMFSGLNLSYNYLLPIKFSLSGFNEELLEVLKKEALGKVSLFGLSLGGFLAADFAFKNPQNVDELILVSIRKGYDREILAEVKLKLGENKDAFLYGFYRDCFSTEDKDSFDWFRKNLLDDYLKQMNLDDLFLGLDYLGSSRLTPESLSSISRVRIFHGQEDKIAPLSEAEELKSLLPHVELITLSGLGHIPILHPNFVI